MEEVKKIGISNVREVGNVGKEKWCGVDMSGEMDLLYVGITKCLKDLLST